MLTIADVYIMRTHSSFLPSAHQFQKQNTCPGDINIHLSFSCSFWCRGLTRGVNCQQCDTRVVPNNKIKLLVVVYARLRAGQRRNTGKHYALFQKSFVLRRKQTNILFHALLFQTFIQTSNRGKRGVGSWIDNFTNFDAL